MSGFSSIKQKEDLRKAIRSGRRLRRGAVSAVYLGGADGAFRLCVIVPKECGNAVRRNRMRRVIRETCRREARDSHIPCSVVMTYRGRIGSGDYAVAAGGAERLLKEIAEKC